jgi:hypothetical protein
MTVDPLTREYGKKILERNLTISKLSGGTLHGVEFKIVQFLCLT